MDMDRIRAIRVTSVRGLQGAGGKRARSRSMVIECFDQTMGEKGDPQLLLRAA